MYIKELRDIIFSNLDNKTDEFKRVFHGRGNFYESFNYLTIDSIGSVLYICFFDEIEEEVESELINLFNETYKNFAFKTTILQRRYLSKAPCEILNGTLEDEYFLLENDLKYHISFNNRNIGIFSDMKKGREYIQSISKGKSVLNLFSYTCAFSISAYAGEANKIVNVDMSKGALTQGRKNHHLNHQDTKKVQFMPYNILKSWSRIKKAGPYDIIIIDPPSFQKGSFAATKDYKKIIKKLIDLAHPSCIVLSCLNAPELDTSFIKDLFKENAPDFIFNKRLDNDITYPALNEEKTLKCMVFKRELNA